MKRLTAALIASIMLALCACQARPIVSNEGQNAPAGLPGLPETPIHTETQAPEGSYSTQTDVRYYPDGDKASANYSLSCEYPVFSTQYAGYEAINSAISLFRDELALRVSQERAPMADPAEGDGLPYTAVTCDVTVARGYTNVVFTEKYSFSGPGETRVTALVFDKIGIERGLAYVSGIYDPLALAAQQVYNQISMDKEVYYADLDMSDIAASLDLNNGFTVTEGGYRLYIGEGQLAKPEEGVIAIELDRRSITPQFVGDMISTSAFFALSPIMSGLARACALSGEGFLGQNPSPRIAALFMAFAYEREGAFDSGAFTVKKADYDSLFLSLFTAPSVPTPESGRFYEIALEGNEYKISRLEHPQEYGVEYTDASFNEEGALVISGALMFGEPGSAVASRIADVSITLIPWEDSPAAYRIDSLVIL